MLKLKMHYNVKTKKVVDKEYLKKYIYTYQSSL